MPTERNIFSRELNKIKDKHGLTHQSWADKSGVPKGTISRYLGYNMGVPNMAHLCAMLHCVNESADEFFAAVNGAVQKADAAAPAAPVVPAIIPTADPRNDADVLRSLQERVLEQTEAIVEHLNTIHEQDAQLREARAQLHALERTICERDASIARRDQRNADLSAELKAERILSESHRKRNHALGVAVAALVVVLIALAAAYVWDIANLHNDIVNSIH